MPTIELPREVDRFVIFFETPRREINAVALATSLVGLSDAIREVNILVNPGYSVEVVVVALESGSFQAIVRTIYNKTRDIFASEPVRNIVYSLIASYIFQYASAPDSTPTIIVQADRVVIESGDTKVIVPKEVFEAQQRLENSERFRSSIATIVAGARSDEDVTGVGIRTEPGPSFPPIYVPREQFAIFEAPRNPTEDIREIVEYANLEISRAILARGPRKWEFFWRGVKVSAPVRDEVFYDKFFAHEITIAPGDVLRVALKITQRRHPDTRIFVNEKYEVIEVFEHIPQMRQGAL